MHKATAFKITCALLFLLCVTSCGSSTSSTDQGGASSNTAPTADAGPDQTVSEGESVQLSGSTSDADGDTLTITWTQSSGTAVTLSDPSVEAPTFTAPDVTADEDLVFEISADDGTATTSDSVTISVQNGTTTVTPTADWILGAGATSPFIIEDGAFVEVNVLDVTATTETVSVTTNSIPNYRVEITQEILDWYNTGYREAAYATLGTLSLGDIVEFGEDVGLSASNCDSGGNGWWPSGGAACPTSQQGLVLDLPTTPTVAMEDCATTTGPVGLWLNGVPVYNWTDGFSYNNENVWQNYAFVARSGGMDICLGHAGGAGSQYHHHSYNDCLRQEVGDDGTGHSPVYGYAGDGYPIHGPYHAAGVRAQSCWSVRDYSAGSATGCGAEGERSCQFVDSTDISQGIETVLDGPNTNEMVSVGTETLLGSPAGYYLEDYYYEASCTAQGDEYLDEYNGHDHDGLGYHYHTSVDENMLPTFPLAPAINYRGNAGGSFSSSTVATGGGGGGGPP